MLYNAHGLCHKIEHTQFHEHYFYKENSKLVLHELLSYISTWESLRTLGKALGCLLYSLTAQVLHLYSRRDGNTFVKYQCRCGWFSNDIDVHVA